MTLSDFIKQLQEIQSEMGPHPTLNDTITFLNQEEELIIESIERDLLPGCKCTFGATVNLKPE